MASEPPGPGPRDGGDSDGIARRERRERKARRRMPVHGRSLEAIMNAIRKRAGRTPHEPEEPAKPGPPKQPARKR